MTKQKDHLERRPWVGMFEDRIGPVGSRKPRLNEASRTTHSVNVAPLRGEDRRQLLDRGEGRLGVCDKHGCRERIHWLCPGARAEEALT